MSAKEEKLNQNDPVRLKIKQLRDEFLLRGTIFIIQPNKRIIVTRNTEMKRINNKYKNYKVGNYLQETIVN